MAILVGGLRIKKFRFRLRRSGKLGAPPRGLSVPITIEVNLMIEELWNSFVLLIPVFFLLTMIFGAGFYIGRVSKRE
jgi:hypothetical protein